MASLGEIIRESQLWKSIFRHPMPLDRRNRIVVMLTNFFLHLHPVSIKKQGIAEPQPGDCVFLHTGHGNIWGNSVYKKMNSEERARARVEFGAGEPGFGISGCEYMASKDIALMGGDTSSNDAQPSGEKGTAFAVHCHTEMQTRRGIWNLENMDLKPLVDAKIYEFAFIWAPLKIIGGTGSPGNPIAIY